MIKIIIIAFIILQILVVIQGIVNVHQYKLIKEVTYRLNCLQGGHLYYEGDNVFCGEQVLQRVKKLK